MTITLDGTITLPSDLQIDPPLHSIDKYDADAVWSRGGTQLRWERERKSVPIDLTAPDWACWVTRTTMDAILAVLNVSSHTLNYHGTSMSVRWRHEDKPVIVAETVRLIRYDEKASGDWFQKLVLKFMWVIAT